MDPLKTMLSKTFFILLGLLLSHFYFPANAEADDEGGSGHSDHGGSGSMDHDKGSTEKKPEAADKTEDKGGTGDMDHGKGDSGKLVCISATHHKMPDGTEMLNSEMSPDPCAGCTEYPCEPESSGKSGHKHDHAGHDKVGTGAASTAAPTTTELDSAQADTATTSSKPQSKVVFLLVSIAVFASLV